MGIAIANGTATAHADEADSGASSSTAASAHSPKKAAKPSAKSIKASSTARRSPAVPAPDSAALALAVVTTSAPPRSLAHAARSTPAATASAAATPADRGVVGKIPVYMPSGIVISPDGATAYVTSGYYGDSVAVINTATNTVTTQVTVGQAPLGIAVSPDGTRLYVTKPSSDAVTVINTATNTVSATITVGDNPQRVAFSADGTRAYVTNWNSNSVSVIDTASNAVTATIAVGSRPTGLAVSPNGARIFVANYYGNTVSVINTATNTVASTISVGSSPTGVAFSPDSTRAYVTTEGTNSLAVINTATNAVVTAIPVGGSPQDVAVSPDGRRLYVVNQDSPTVSVINTVTNTVVDTFAAGSGNQVLDVAVSPNGKRVYVANWSANSVVVIDPAGASASLSLNPPNTTTGAITGKITVTNPNNAKLTFTATQPARGTITINKTTGAFTYTPTTVARHAASALTATGGDKIDTFTVTMTTSLGDTVTMPVTVTISSKNSAPSGAKAKLGTADPYTGAITVSITASDADKDALTFSTSAPMRGTLKAGEKAGTFIYTPNEQARLDAGVTNASAAIKADNFTVTIQDAHGGTTSVAVNVRVSPIMLTPTASNLFRNMHDSDVIGAQLVLGSDKKTKRMVIYTSGINLDAGELAAALSGVTFGTVDSDVSNFIDTMYEEWKPTEIMLVGFSGGGIQMQNYAASGAHKDAVTTVVTYGAPLSKTLTDLGVGSGSKKSALAIVDKGDKIINWSQQAAWDSYEASKTDKGAIAWTDTKLLGTEIGRNLGVGNHDGPTYVAAAKSFDTLIKTAGSGLKNINKDIQRFGGTVLDETHTSVTY